MDVPNESNYIKYLFDYVTDRPMALLRLTNAELEDLSRSRKGLSEFTFTVPHRVLSGVQTPCLCLIFGTAEGSRGGEAKLIPVAYIAVMQSRSAVATLDSRIKFKRTVSIEPRSESGLLRLLGRSRFATDFKARQTDKARLQRLPPGLSAAILQVLEADERNHWALRSVGLGLHKPAGGSKEAQQYDAVQMALKAFGLQSDALAAKLEVSKHAQSALLYARVREDDVIEHDARKVPGYNLVDSVTGRATFRNGEQTLEVFTANRRKLEEAFGVDLIYLNSFQRSAIMVQYKMLERQTDNEETDWIYTQDRHLEKQMAAMEKFSAAPGDSGGFRLSADAFYFKFARRQGPSSKSSVLLPLSHLKLMLDNPTQRTRSGALKLSYDALDGRYLRQSTFFGLLQSGYIGSYAETTDKLKALIEFVLATDSSLVIAVQRETTEEEKESDRETLIARLDMEKAEFFEPGE